MRNISITLNVILLVAVAFLYYLHFKDKSGNTMDVEQKQSVSFPNAGILFVNSDSLLDEYEFYKNKKSEFEEAKNRIKTELRVEGDKLQKEIETYQQQGSGMSEMQRAQKEEQLQMKQQQLMQRKDDLLAKLDDQQGKSSDELYAKLNDYLRRKKDKNYNYVLGFQKGGGILYANDSLNITKEIVDGLNKEYKEQK